jgi:hypothetical protein
LSFKVAIIGAGWYGCHIGSSLRSLGFEVQVFERESRTLHRASGNNQFRLHMGFHYARHHGTRQQSRDGFLRFIERYPDLSAPIDDNIYAVPTYDSLVDFTTYKMIMASSGIEFTQLPDTQGLLKNISGAIQTNERVLMINHAREYFEDDLREVLQLETPVETFSQTDGHVEVNGERFDYIIDATWGHLSSIPRNLYYQPTILLYYEAQKNHPAVTLVDGALCSVYPTEDPSIFTLSSVEHTPLGNYTSALEARHRLNAVNQSDIYVKQIAMEEQITRYLPSFKDNFRFRGVQFAIKTKPVGMADDRSCAVYRDQRVFTVLSGKIDTIFFATERILALLESSQSVKTRAKRFAIRDDIVYPSSRRGGE